MDTTPLGLARSVLPQMPLIFLTALLAFFGLSPNASVQEIMNEVFVAFARPVFGRPAALLKSQIHFNKDWGIRGRMWIAKYTIPRPQDEIYASKSIVGVREALMAAILELGDGEECFTLPDVVDVQTEWTGYRHGVSHVSPRPKLQEHEHYSKLMEEVDTVCPTLLYFHGGAFWLVVPLSLPQRTPTDLAFSV